MKIRNEKKNLEMDPQIKEQESPQIQLTSFVDQEMKRKELVVPLVHQISLQQMEDNSGPEVQLMNIQGIENLAKPQPMIKYQQEQTQHPGKIKYEIDEDWIEIRERKPVMHILLNVAKKMIRAKFNHKKDVLISMFS